MYNLQPSDSKKQIMALQSVLRPGMLADGQVLPEQGRCADVSNLLRAGEFRRQKSCGQEFDHHHI